MGVMCLFAFLEVRLWHSADGSLNVVGSLDRSACEWKWFKVGQGMCPWFA